MTRRLIDDGEYSIAVVVAHMACEIAAERSLSEAFVTAGIPKNLESAIMRFVNGRNLANEQIQNLYTALTGNKVQNAAFWPKFKASATRRDEIMHKGRIAGQTEAEESYKAASDFVAYLKK